MVKVLLLVWAGVSLSVAITVKVIAPLVVGVPVNLPFIPKVSPAGRLPDVTTYVSVPVPPVDVKV
jgi:hypothetical protein